MADFYRFLYNLDFSKFCEILEKPTSDAWAVEKFQLMTRDFGRFLCDCESVAEILYQNYLSEFTIKLKNGQSI